MKHTPSRRQVTDRLGNLRKTWCGPYALAVVAGKTYEFAYQMLKQIRGKRHACGVYNTNMDKAFGFCGLKAEFVKAEKRCNLRKYIDEYLAPNKLYIINITRHYVVVDTRDHTTIDNQNPEWVPIENSKHLRCLVQFVAEIKNPAIEPLHQNEEFNFDLTNWKSA